MTIEKEDREAARVVIKRTIREHTPDGTPTELITKLILANLDAENFKIVKRMSIGGSIY